MSSPVRLVKYWGGRFRLCKENLPAGVPNDVKIKTLLLLQNKYANYKWGTTTPGQRLQEMDDYVYSLLQSYFV